MGAVVRIWRPTSSRGLPLRALLSICATAALPGRWHGLRISATRSSTRGRDDLNKQHLIFSPKIATFHRLSDNTQTTCKSPFSAAKIHRKDPPESGRRGTTQSVVHASFRQPSRPRCRRPVALRSAGGVVTRGTGILPVHLQGHPAPKIMGRTPMPRTAQPIALFDGCVPAPEASGAVPAGGVDWSSQEGR